MEMPKGYNDLVKNMDRLGWFPHSLTVVVLLKEMAEALEKGIEHEDCPSVGSCHISGHDEMRAVLKKFKEWK